MKMINMSNKKLFEREIGEIFKHHDEEYELLNHDNSGSLSAGPRCRRLRDDKIVFLSYIDWSQDAKN